MKKLILPKPPLGLKDENGIYIKMPEVLKVVESSMPDIDVSLDDIGKRIIVAMDRATKTLLANITAGSVDRDTIGALKDCSVIYKDLRKDEKDLLDSLSDDELERMIKK